MIINHEHKFCYFAIPRTGSTAISEALIKNYSSDFIMKRHSSFDEFKAKASRSERAFFKFASVRNPLDSLVSSYFKKKSDHNSRFSRGTFKKGRPIGRQSMEEYRFITSNNASFSDYFLKFYSKRYRRPRHETTVANMDDLIQFETLEEDFKRIVESLELEYIPTESINPTEGRDEHFLSYYSEEIIPVAIKSMGPIMRAWNYEFPDEWSKYL